MWGSTRRIGMANRRSRLCERRRSGRQGSDMEGSSKRMSEPKCLRISVVMSLQLTTNNYLRKFLVAIVAVCILATAEPAAASSSSPEGDGDEDNRQCSMLVFDPQEEFVSNRGMHGFATADIAAEALVDEMNRALDDGCRVFVVAATIPPHSCSFLTAEELADPRVNEWFNTPPYGAPDQRLRFRTFKKRARSMSLFSLLEEDEGLNAAGGDGAKGSQEHNDPPNHSIVADRNGHEGGTEALNLDDADSVSMLETGSDVVGDGAEEEEVPVGGGEDSDGNDRPYYVAGGFGSALFAEQTAALMAKPAIALRLGMARQTFDKCDPFQRCERLGDGDTGACPEGGPTGDAADADDGCGSTEDQADADLVRFPPNRVMAPGGGAALSSIFATRVAEMVKERKDSGDSSSSLNSDLAHSVPFMGDIFAASGVMSDIIAASGRSDGLELYYVSRGQRGDGAEWRSLLSNVEDGDGSGGGDIDERRSRLSGGLCVNKHAPGTKPFDDQKLGMAAICGMDGGSDDSNPIWADQETAELLEKRRFAVFGGRGGVGKTNTQHGDNGFWREIHAGELGSSFYYDQRPIVPDNPNECTYLIKKASQRKPLFPKYHDANNYAHICSGHDAAEAWKTNGGQQPPRGRPSSSGGNGAASAEQGAIIGCRPNEAREMVINYLLASREVRICGFGLDFAIKETALDLKEQGVPIVRVLSHLSFPIFDPPMPRAFGGGTPGDGLSGNGDNPMRLPAQLPSRAVMDLLSLKGVELDHGGTFAVGTQSAVGGWAQGISAAAREHVAKAAKRNKSKKDPNAVSVATWNLFGHSSNPFEFDTRIHTFGISMGNIAAEMARRSFEGILGLASHLLQPHSTPCAGGRKAEGKQRGWKKSTLKKLQGMLVRDVVTDEMWNELKTKILSSKERCGWTDTNMSFGSKIEESVEWVDKHRWHNSKPKAAPYPGDDTFDGRPEIVALQRERQKLEQEEGVGDQEKAEFQARFNLTMERASNANNPSGWRDWHLAAAPDDGESKHSFLVSALGSGLAFRRHIFAADYATAVLAHDERRGNHIRQRPGVLTCWQGSSWEEVWGEGGGSSTRIGAREKWWDYWLSYMFGDDEGNPETSTPPACRQMYKTKKLDVLDEGLPKCDEIEAIRSAECKDSHHLPCEVILQNGVDEEEEHWQVMQLLELAIFDAAMLLIAYMAAPKAKYEVARSFMCATLSGGVRGYRFQHIVHEEYSNTDVIFLQDVPLSTIERGAGILEDDWGSFVPAPPDDTSGTQHGWGGTAVNSSTVETLENGMDRPVAAILLRKENWPGVVDSRDGDEAEAATDVKDISREVLKQIEDVSGGTLETGEHRTRRLISDDNLVAAVTRDGEGQRFMLASFSVDEFGVDPKDPANVLRAIKKVFEAKAKEPSLHPSGNDKPMKLLVGCSVALERRQAVEIKWKPNQEARIQDQNQNGDGVDPNAVKVDLVENFLTAAKDLGYKHAKHKKKRSDENSEVTVIGKRSFLQSNLGRSGLYKAQEDFILCHGCNTIKDVARDNRGNRRFTADAGYPSIHLSTHALVSANIELS